jgi:nucleotide-binding universal stress UspA family protein
MNRNLTKSISSILVAIDGSNHSLKAADYAMNLANKYKANLFVITVTYIPEKYHVSQPEIIESKQHQMEMNAAKNWFETYIQTAEKRGIKIRTELLNSHRPVDYVILEYAEEKNIDLVVAGTRGRSALGRVLLGSVASGIVTYSHCPVLLVK